MSGTAGSSDPSPAGEGDPRDPRAGWGYPAAASPPVGAPRAPPPPSVGGSTTADDILARARAALSDVVDPEIPVLSVGDLGILRDVTVEEGRLVVTITPTYSGCPAMNMIAVDIGLALERAGFPDPDVRTVLHPAWTTEWMTEAGRAKLADYGIAPPARGGGRRALFGVEVVACPRCGSSDTERLAEFGSTSCKALWRCRACREPFDYFRCH